MPAPQLVVRVAATLDELKKNLAEGANVIDTTRAALTRMASSYDGSKVIQQANATVAAIQQVGGVTNLTADEQRRANQVIEQAIEKYRLLGKEAPDGLRQMAEATAQAERKVGVLESTFARFATAFAAGALIDRGVTALMSFGRQAFETADRIVGMSEKTGLSIESLQRMNFVAGQTGTTLDDFSRAVFQLGARLAGDDKSVAGAVGKLGLSLESLRAMRPEEQFDTITRALSLMESPQERNRVALDMFGKSVAEIIPAIVEKYDELRDSATVASDAQIRSVEAAGDKWDELKNRVLVSSMKVIAGFVDMADAARDNEASMQHWVETGQLLPVVLPQIASTARDAASGLRDLTMSADELAAVQADLAANSNIYVSRLQNAQDEVDALTADQLIQIRAARQLGASTEELARAFHLTSDAARLLQSRLSEDADAAKQAADFMAMTRDEAAKLANVVQGAGLPATDDWAESMDVAAQSSEALRTDLKFTAETVAHVGEEAKKAAEKIRTLSGEMLTADEIAKRREQGGQFSLAELTPEQYEAAGGDKRIAEIEATYALYPGRKSGGSGPTGLGTNDAQGYAAMLAEQRLYAQLLAARKRIKGYADGVMNAPGGWAWVGERGPELMRVPQGADIVPNHALGSVGATVTIAPGAFVFNYPMMNDPNAKEQFAAFIFDVFMRQLRASGVRVPTSA